LSRALRFGTTKYSKKEKILERVTFIADIRNKWLAGSVPRVFALES